MLKSVNYIPLFIVFLAVSFIVAVIYIHYQTPVYSTSIKLLLKDAGKKGSSGSDEVLSDLVGNTKVNLNNEIEVLKSVELMERVVLKQQLNTSYYSIGKVNTLELFNTNPESKFIQFSGIRDSSSYYNITIQVDESGQIYRLEGESKIPVKNHVPIVMPQFTYVINISNHTYYNPEYKYSATWAPTAAVANNLASSLGIVPLSKDATVLVITTSSQVPLKSQVVLNTLTNEYNSYSVEQNNRIADNTIRFIDDRLLVVSGELGEVETGLENFKRETNSVDISTQASQEYGKIKDIEDGLNTQALRTSVVNMITNYINNPARRFELVPSNLGIDDATVTSLITRYNEGVLQRNDMLKTLGEKNITITTLESQLDELRAKIVESLKNVKATYADADAAAQRQYRQLVGDISTMPAKEKKLLEIERQQGIKEKLYLYLLEKREESAISRAAVASRGTSVDEAKTVGPVNLKNGNVYLMALFTGLGIPLLIVYLMDLLNDKLTTRQEILKITEAPIVGEISHFKGRERKIIADNSRGILPEQFRVVRTNLRYFLNNKPGGSVILVTSTMPGEGKTFISLNLAAVLAVSGKKTILIEFDMRRPKISSAIGIEKQSMDLPAFLAGGNIAPQDIIRKIEGEENLFAITTSYLPPNPAELLLSERLAELFVYMRTNYDYIVMDSPPLGIVSDAKVLAEYSDLCLYLIRQRYTQRKQVKMIDEVYKEKKLPNLALIVNDVKVKGIRSYYGYGYTYGSGNYGYDYSAGYGYYGTSRSKKSGWLQRLKNLRK